MKKFIQWLAKVFNANITKEVIVEKKVIRYIQKDEILVGDIQVEGDLIVDGCVAATGNISAKSMIKIDRKVQP